MTYQNTPLRLDWNMSLDEIKDILCSEENAGRDFVVLGDFNLNDKHLKKIAALFHDHDVTEEEFRRLLVWVSLRSDHTLSTNSPSMGLT